MKIAIIGYGFVGKALEAGFNDDVSIIKIDPILKTSINDLSIFDPEVIFICVPTPMKSDSSQDISILMNVIDEINSIGYDSLVVLKSTVLPNYVEKVKGIFNKFVYNPEFLREKHAEEDFINSSLILFGGSTKNTRTLSDIYLRYTKCVNTDHVHTDELSASLIKYSINAFLATKVSFFNELKEVFDTSGTNESWKNFINAISRDKRIGKSHMNVPGHDGRLGFGGACLPKDSAALFNYSNDLDKPLKVLKSAIKTNNILRAKYNNQTEREIEQNINFEGEE